MKTEMPNTNTIRIVLLLILCSLTGLSQAQNIEQKTDTEYRPTTNWPYLNPLFEQGTVWLTNGTYSNATMNIHLHESILQCIGGGGRISRITFPNIEKILIGNKEYVYADGTLMQRIVSNADSTVFLLLHTEPDFETLLRSSSTYHMNLGTVTSAKIQQLNLKGRNNEVHDEMRAVWYDGKTIPLRQKYYFYAEGTLTHATRKNILNKCQTAEKKKEMKAFIKSNKLKTDNDTDMIKLFNKLYSD